MLVTFFFFLIRKLKYREVEPHSVSQDTVPFTVTAASLETLLVIPVGAFKNSSIAISVSLA